MKNIKLSKKYLLFIYLLIFHSSIIISQNKKFTDSLINILNKENLPKDQKAILLRKIAYNHPNLNKGLVYGKKLLKLAQDTDNKRLEADAYSTISNTHRILGNTSASLDATLKAEKLFETLNDKNNQATCWQQLAISFSAQKDYSNSIKYSKKAKDYYANKQKEKLLSGTIINLGETYRLAKYLDSASVCFKQLINQESLAGYYASGNLGMVYNEQNKLPEAKKALNKAIKSIGIENDPYSTSVYIAELGQVYKKEKKFEQAEKNLVQALNLAKVNNLKEQIRDFSKMLAEFYEETQQYPKALENQKQFQIYQDSLVNRANIQKIEQLKAGYEIDKRETEIGLLNTINKSQRRWVIGLGVGIGIFFLLASLLYSGNQKIKKSNRLLSEQKEIISKKEQEKAWLLKELNHRVKNNLQMIASLLNLQSNKLTGHPAQEAIITGRQRVEALSLVHRKLYQEGVDTRIHVKEYISELILGLFHAYNADFEPEFEIADTNVNIDSAIPLALIVNEITINALKYAYEGVDNPELKIKIEPVEEKRLHIEISDNGVGFGEIDASKSNSLGLKIINSLIMQLEGTIKKVNNHGTHWHLNVKVK